MTLPTPTSAAAQLPTESSVEAMVSLLRDYANDQRNLGWAKDAALIDAAATMLQAAPTTPASKSLSPTAQAVLDASLAVFWRPLIDAPVFHHKSIAAALRATADQVVPAKLYLYAAARAEAEGIREDLLAIATELEAQP